MTTQIVENLELFSEAQLESLEFLPEELENIEYELYPNLDSISLEVVAKDLETYFEGYVEQAGLEGRGGRGGRGGTRGGTRRGTPRSRDYLSPSERDEVRTITANIRPGNPGGRVYNNAGGHGGTRLPSLAKGQEYREYDLGQANDGTRGRHRLVVLIGSNGRSVRKYS
ncbi:hypothetical protein H6G76_34285 [Nostoc sp. FACHB-152]|uniref:ribonuclease domain-containing protein n=1 Tax=Nostoc sp. FACHB-152 TaxID=2692837 RepID=UPI00168A11CF|nr:ribonuclease domain-containing protein [Nostoc sp. FACHB-152]MBD2452094.1 hypothetical protein [Nostoc sp. FACHB-152]